MTDTQARNGLRRMLRTLTAGSLLHLLAELYRDSAERTATKADAGFQRRAQETAATLFVVGIGIGAVCPRPPEA
jgi:hypothetical protein